MSDKTVCSFFIRSKLFKECGNLSKHKTEVRKGNEKSEMVQSAELNLKTSVEGNGSNNLGNVECEQTESRINDFELVDSDEKKYVNHIIAGYREIKVETNAIEHQDDDVNCNAVSKRKRGRPSKNCSDVSIKIEKGEASRETYENMSELQQNKFELKVALRKGSKRKRRKTRTHFKGVTKKKASKDTLKAENEKPVRVQCTVCEKLVRPKNLKRHRATHDRPYKCSVCGRKCRDERRYEVHMASHTGGKPYSCETCGRCFSTAAYVKVHRRTHTGDKPYFCEFCGKSFKANSGLQSHLTIHYGIKKHRCEICDKAFYRKSALQRHMMSHTDERHYQCEICGKYFRQNGALTVHKLIHTGERKYPCPVCGSRFTQNSSVKVHMKIHLRDSMKSGHKRVF